MLPVDFVALLAQNPAGVLAEVGTPQQVQVRLQVDVGAVPIVQIQLPNQPLALLGGLVGVFLHHNRVVLVSGDTGGVRLYLEEAGLEEVVRGNLTVVIDHLKEFFGDLGISQVQFLLLDQHTDLVRDPVFSVVLGKPRVVLPKVEPVESKLLFDLADDLAVGANSTAGAPRSLAPLTQLVQGLAA